MGRHIGEVGVFQSCCGKKKIQFPTAPEGIEIAGDDDFLVGILGKGVQLLELVLPVPVFQRQMDDKNGDGSQISLNDQSLYSLLEIVETKIFDALLGQQGVALLFQNRDFLRQ
jgi:hypothetical protein